MELASLSHGPDFKIGHIQWPVSWHFYARKMSTSLQNATYSTLQPVPPLPRSLLLLLLLLLCCLVVPSVRSSVCPRLSTVGNVLFTTSATSDAAGGCGTTCCHSTTCNGNVVVGCRKVGNWQLAAPFGLNKSRSRETSFRSRIDLERVSAL